ncbi:MAG: hypothetical protein N2C14_27395 [Planctomycetales bacterium]
MKQSSFITIAVGLFVASLFWGGSSAEGGDGYRWGHHWNLPLETYQNPGIKKHQIQRPTYPYYYGRGFMAWPHYQMYHYPHTARTEDHRRDNPRGLHSGACRHCGGRGSARSPCGCAD